MPLARIYAVDNIDLSFIKTQPPGLLNFVSGRVTSSGWSEGQLLPWVYLLPPEDGIQDFDVVAETPPDGAITLPMLTPMLVSHTIHPIDLKNYWGPGLRLNGVRCHAMENVKTALITGTDQMPGARLVTAEALEKCAPIEDRTVPGFEADIKPKFRPSDVAVMRAIAGFDLHSYDDVSTNADRIFARIADRSMPCDGPWPQSDIDLFEAWKDGGKPQ